MSSLETVAKRFKPSTSFSPVSQYSPLLQSNPNLGSSIQLFTNHFRLIVPKCTLYHYDVDIRNRSDRRVDRRQADAVERKFRKLWHQINFNLLQQFVDQNSSLSDDLFYNTSTSGVIQPAFDGIRNLYTCRPLQKLATDRNRRFEREITIEFNGKPNRFLIAIKFVAQLNLELFDDFFAGRIVELPNDLIRALDIILRFRPVAIGLPVGNSIYPKQSPSFTDESPVSPFQIGGAKSVVFGHYQSVRLMSHQLNLVIDRSTAVLYDFGDARKFIGKLLRSNQSIETIPVDPWTTTRLHPIATSFSPVAPLSFSDCTELIRLIDFSLPTRFHEVQRNIELLNVELRGVQVDATHLSYPRRYKVFELTNKCASDLYFDFNPQQSSSHALTGSDRRRPSSSTSFNLRRLNVVSYFAEKYDRQINGNLPCFNVGNRRRPVYMPLEVCRIAANQVAKKLNPEESSQLIRLASSQPVQARFELIEQSLLSVKHQSESVLQEFNIDLDTKPIEVEGIRLHTPTISYSNLAKYSPVYGNWGLNDKRFFEPARLDRERWAILNFSQRLSGNDLNRLVQQMIMLSNQLGMTIEQPIFANDRLVGGSSFDPRTSQSVVDALKQVRSLFSNIAPPQMLLFIIPKSKGDRIYQDIKREAEINLGLVTQCFTERNVDHVLHWQAGNAPVSARTNGEQILTNLLLKVNAKLGGTNCVLNSDDMPDLGSLCQPDLMVLGADVTHPAPSDRFAHSIASVVASCDPHFCKYINAVRVQARSNEEMIKDMKSIMVELLEGRFERFAATRSQNVKDCFPKHIVYYRDGVSEGQYKQLLELEFKSMKEAFVEIDKKYKLNGTFSPSVTLIVVLKRHNTRFRSTTDHRPDTVRANDALFGAISPSSLPSSSSSSESMHSANLNIPPGTLVDHPSILGTDHEFFLCSHHSNQGTIRSTHYYVLLNEMNLNKSQLCRFSYYLCYLFAKCTKSISIPAPVKYAHLAAYRARQHLSIVSDHESSTDSGASSTGSSPTPSQLATPGPLSPFARPSFRHLPPLPSHLPPPPIGWPPMLPPSSSAGPSPPSPVPSSFSPDLLLPPTFFLHQLPPRPPPFPPMQWRLPLPPGFPMRPPSFSPGRPWLVPPSPRTASARIESRALRKSGPRSEPPSLQATARTTLQLQSLIQVKPDLRLTFYFI